jgi:CHAT domain-containing protein
LHLAAIEQLVQLDEDSALTLYRAARAADPTYFAAQYEYFTLMQVRLRVAELQREFATSDSTSALQLCLMAASQLTNEAHEGPVARFRALEARFGPTQCTDAFLLRKTDYSAKRAARAVRDTPESAEIWSSIATQLYDAGQWREADQALRNGEKAVLSPIGRVGLVLGRINREMQRDTAGARRSWTVLATEVQRDGRPGVLATYLSARCLNEPPFPGATEESRREPCRQFDALVRLRRARYTEWRLTRGLAWQLLFRGDLTAAAPVLERLVALADGMGTAGAGMQVDSYTQRGRSFQKAGRLDLALRDLKHAIALGPAAPMPYYMAEAYHNLAHTYEGMGRVADAAAAADSFAAQADKMPFGSARWMSRHDAGLIRWNAGWHAAAMRDFDAMVRVVDEHGNDGHYFAGEYFERIGDLGRALEYYGAGARMPYPDYRVFEAQARIYDALGFADSAEAAARRHDGKTDGWSMLERPVLPDLLAKRGRVAEAVALTDTWARRRLAGGNIEGAAIAHLHLAELLLLNRDAKAALTAATRADSLNGLLRLSTHASKARTLRGRALFDDGKRPAGILALREAVRLAEARPSASALLSTNLALGNALELEGRRVEALAAYDRAGTAVERMTAGLNDDAYRTGFKSQHMAPFDGALRILLRSAAPGADTEAALDWSARRKAAALMLTFASLSAGAGQPRASPARRVGAATLRGRLRPDEALVDYSLVDSMATAIVVRREGVTRVPLAVAPLQLAKWVEALRRPLTATPGGRIDLAHSPFNAAVAESLHKALIVPLGASLAGVKRLAIVPDGALWNAPFAALVVERIPGAAGAPRRSVHLIERYELRLLPSAAFLGGGDIPAVPQGFRVEALTYGVPGGAEELAAIRSAIGPGRVVARDGATATERAALGSTASVLHLAVHGVVNDHDPLSSHMRLAPAERDDGLLHLPEIANRRGAPQLVVLTACEAVSGKLFAGEGLVGLARAFLVSGARQVIASEWPVDASAADLTAVFYRELARGAGAPAALRAAQLALMRQPSTAHPIHWAGFVAFDAGTGQR